MSCEPGTFPSYDERTRVFNGEALTERIPECIPCPTGSYEPRVGSDQCMPCPEFHTTTSQHSTSKEQCFGECFCDHFKIIMNTN